MAKKVSDWVTFAWDTVERRLQAHRRKVIVCVFVFGFLPQWGPAAKSFYWDSVVPRFKAMDTPPDFSWLSWSAWNWLTVPVGLVLLWLTLRKQAPSTPVLSGGADAFREGQRGYQNALEERRDEGIEEENGKLKSDLAQTASERDEAQRILGNVKWNFALSRLGWMVERCSLKKYLPEVIIRSAGYADFGLVETIEKLFKEHTGWPITIDTSNNPLLRPSDSAYKVVFVVDLTGPFENIANIFDEGRLLPGVAIATRKTADPAKQFLILVEVLPSKSSS